MHGGSIAQVWQHSLKIINILWGHKTINFIASRHIDLHRITSDALSWCDFLVFISGRAESDVIVWNQSVSSQ